MPITVRKKLVLKVEDAEFVFEPIVLADIMDFAENVTHKEMLALLAEKLESWTGIVDENGEAIECSSENFLKVLPVDIAGRVMKELLDQSGMGEQFAKKSEPRSQ